MARNTASDAAAPVAAGTRVPRLRVEALRFPGGGPVDLALAAGECVALSGPSGAGKTLLLRTLADMERHEGRILLDGRDCRSIPAPSWRRRVGLLPPESGWWRDTVGEHFGSLDAAWLARLGFPGAVLQWPVARLSTGERQRLALLRLLVNRPSVLLLDEPTANLDAENTTRVETLLAEYRNSAAAAVLWVTHDPWQARRVADRRFRMDSGRLLPESQACTSSP